MKSSEFRRRYTSLTRTTPVEANGRRIGMWIPAATKEELAEAFARGERGEAKPTDQEILQRIIDLSQQFLKELEEEE